MLSTYNLGRMETVPLPKFKAFEWDDGNVKEDREPPNWKSHSVTQQEAEQVFFNRPLIVADDRIRVISARDMSRRQRKVYQQ